MYHEKTWYIKKNCVFCVSKEMGSDESLCSLTLLSVRFSADGERGLKLKKSEIKDTLW